MALTNVAIKSAKPGAKPFKLADSEGLHLLVQPNGTRCWRMNYRFLGKHKTLACAAWTIPAHKTKMRSVHSIPHSAQALDIIASIETDASFSTYLFPSLRSTRRPMSESTINAALRRLG